MKIRKKFIALRRNKRSYYTKKKEREKCIALRTKKEGKIYGIKNVWYYEERKKQRYIIRIKERKKDKSLKRKKKKTSWH